MQPTLYNIDLELTQYLDAVEFAGGEVTQETAEKLTGLMAAHKQKALGTAHYIQNAKDDIKRAKERRATFDAQIKAAENRVNNLSEFLKYVVAEKYDGKIKEELFSVGIAKNPHRLIIDNEKLVPDEYKRYKITIDIDYSDFNKINYELEELDIQHEAEVVVDKNAIKAAIKNGEKISGAHLEQTTRLNIR